MNKLTRASKDIFEHFKDNHDISIVETVDQLQKIAEDGLNRPMDATMMDMAADLCESQAAEWRKRATKLRS